MSSYKYSAALAVLALSLTLTLCSWYSVVWWSSLVVACTWSIILATYSQFSHSTRIYPSIEAGRARYYPTLNLQLDGVMSLDRWVKMDSMPATKECSFSHLLSFYIQVPKVANGTQPPVPVGLQPIISEVLELILRDFVESWYSELVKHNPELFLKTVRQDMSHVSAELCHLLSSVDYLQFITEDIPHTLSQHLHQVQLASSSLGEQAQPFVLHECAKDRKREVEHLDELSKLLCDRLLPAAYDSLSHQLAVAILTKQVLEPTVESLTNADNVNQSLLSYLTYQEELLSSYKRTFKYAASYEDFVELILKCSKIDELKQIRYHIITEIMHSTTLQGLKTKGDESESANNLTQSSSRTKAAAVGKVELLRSRDLKRYANQLRIAKAKCEKRIADLGGDEYEEYVADDQSSNQHRGGKIISFKLTMNNLACRGCFHSYLKAGDSESLLEYWVAAGTLRSCDPSDRHRLAAEIFYKYIDSSVSLVKVDKSMIKRMEAFLIGNRGPEAFYDAQEVVYHQLEEKHYPQFIVSNIYHNFIINWDGTESIVSGETISTGSTEDVDEEFQEVEDGEIDYQQTTSEYNKKKLSQIDERIFNKTQAHQVITSHVCETASTSRDALLADLEAQLEKLKLERRSLEAHQEQVEAWWKHVGQWSASVVQHEVVKEEDGWTVYYLILIRLQDNQYASPAHTNGWIVSRTLQQIRELYSDLCQVDGDLVQLPLPSKVRIGKPSEEYIKKAKTMISSFLEWVIADRTLSQSSELFNFVSTHPHLIKDSVRKSAKFKVSGIFKRKQHSSDDDSADLLFYTQHGDREELRSKDSIAGPLYSLISEVFELKGTFKLLRRTLVHLVQVTYGKSINRQIRETVGWMVSEPMLVYYLKFLREFFWPGGALAEPSIISGEEQCRQNRMKAKSALIRNVPELVIRIFGEKSARRGFTKLFDTFQDQALNKHFFYMLLSRFTDRLFPEIADAKSSLLNSKQLSDWTIPSANAYQLPNQNTSSGDVTGDN